MNRCEAVSERMPAVASGRGEWSPAELEHLAGCGDCTAEWELVSAASVLGRTIAVDPRTLTPRLLERVRVARREDRQRRWVARSAQVAGLAIAAVLLLTIVPRRRDVAPIPTSPGVATTEVAGLQLAELDGAAPSELETVLAEFDEPTLPGSSLDGPDVEGLDMSQVERALRSWEES